MEHRFILEPYNGIGSRYQCPQCNKIRNFSRYIDTETGEQLPDHVGRCNSEITCGYHYRPKQHFDDTGQSFENESRPFKPVRATARPEPKPVSFIPAEALKGSLKGYEGNHLATYLDSLFGEEITSQLIGRYFIGSSKHWAGSTVFWQIDSQGKVRAGKIMLYNPTTGKRVKKPYNHITWTHKALKLPDFNLKQCFFGEHLLKDKTKPVAIVESEKTAIIASQYLPQFIWLAVGSLTNLSQNRCAILQGRLVTLFPDLNAFDKWQDKAKSLTGMASITVSDLLERKATLPEKEQGLDLADYLIRFAYKEFVLPEPEALEVRTTSAIKKTAPVTTGKRGNHGNSGNGPPPSITFEIEELESFFNSFSPPVNPIKLDAAMTVTDVPLFVRSHMATIKANQGRRSFKPYFDRLQLLKEKLDNYSKN